MNYIIRFLFIFFSLMLSACHEKDYDIIQEAKKFIYDNDEIEVAEEQDKKSEKKNKKDRISKTKKPKQIKELEKNKKRAKKEEVIKEEIKTSRILESIKEKEASSINTEEKQNNKIKIERQNYKERIKVGVMLPLSGEHKNIGNLILNAIEMAIFQTKKNKLVLLIKDTEANPKKSKEAFIELKDEGVDIIIGPLFSKSLAAIHTLSNNNDLNIFALTNNINLGKKGIWIFGVDPQAQTKRALEVALEMELKKIAALLPKNAYGLLLYDTILNFSKENSIDIENIEFYENSIESQRIAAQNLSKGFDKYQESLDLIKEKEDNEEREKDIMFLKKPFDIVFIAASGQNLTVLSSQLQYNNVDPNAVQYLGISSWEDRSILNEPALEGGIFVTTSEFYQKKIKLIYQKSFNQEMPKIAMIAYDVIALLGSIDYKENKVNINEIINDEGYLGLRGLFRLRENGIVERAFELKQVKNKNFKIYKKANSQFSNF